MGEEPMNQGKITKSDVSKRGGTMKTGKYRSTAKQEKAVLEFADANKCVINPGGWAYYLEGFNEFGHCVCDKTKTRVHCPCSEARQEIAEKGHCLCHLFWRDYETYMVAKNIKRA
jgi:hypothetical protein